MPSLDPNLSIVPSFVYFFPDGFDAWEINGDVMYDVHKFSPYGRLSGKKLEDLRAGTDRGARITASLAELGAPRREVRAADVELMLAETRAAAFDAPDWRAEAREAP